MDRNYIWEGDYGNRSHLIPVLSNLLKHQNANSLQMVAAFVNNVPYSFEFYIALSYDQPELNHIDEMKTSMKNADLIYRPDITLEELLSGIGQRRFNSATFSDEDSFINSFPLLFEFVEKKELKNAGFSFSGPLGKELPIFLSHQSQNKAEIEELIPYLNAEGLPIWFDKYNIDYGESIVDAVQKGIKSSVAVIFWITDEFLQSNWCKREMSSFLSRFAGKNNVLILTVVDSNIDMNDLDEIFLSELKYFKRNNETIKEIASELLPTIKKYYNRNINFSF